MDRYTGVASQVICAPCPSHHPQVHLAIVGELDFGAADPRSAVELDRGHGGVLADGEGASNGVREVGRTHLDVCPRSHAEQYPPSPRPAGAGRGRTSGARARCGCVASIRAEHKVRTVRRTQDQEMAKRLQNVSEGLVAGNAHR